MQSRIARRCDNVRYWPKTDTRHTARAFFSLTRYGPLAVVGVRVGMVLRYALLVLLASCANVGVGRVYSPLEVNRELARLEGQRITVRGYVVLGTNSRVLFQSRAAYAHASQNMDTPDDYCLTILNNDALLWDNAGVLRDQTVIVDGTVVRRDPRVFDLQSCLTANAEPVPSGFLIDQASLRRAINRQP